MRAFVDNCKFELLTTFYYRTLEGMVYAPLWIWFVFSQIIFHASVVQEALLNSGFDDGSWFCLVV
ncbi:hypothetical protein BDZ89DRAFT_1073377, partial [Hymenopellis radicata]